ncbi:cation transporter [Ramlibacter sp. RBP-2]|uniref:Cation transporter n=1 Tax=Ramlibacter lithotrophicus TaxID=2606681 RepID=A0A7X6I8I5_9BURK|nr:cation diffusion facilitator family transporter [Ramlibacter lithotrophicus]NKE68636.1 cation transporter [Ramlibacter lithotrophicus]
MSGSHNHAVPTGNKEKALWVALALTGSFMIAETIAGFITGSLALISDAAHMLTDAAALAIALAAVKISKRPADLNRTYGYYRFEILAAAFNALMLFGVAAYILVEAYGRFRNPPEIQTGAMIVVALVGLVVNIISMRLLSADKDASLNVKGAYLEVWSDMLGSLGVIAGAVVIRFTGWKWVDPFIAVAIGLWVLPRTWVLLKQSLNILLEGVPRGIELARVQAALLAFPGVTGVHDLHIWALTSGRLSLTAHIVHDPLFSHDSMIEPLNEMLTREFALFHTTLQLEVTPCRQSRDGDAHTVTSAAKPTEYVDAR